MRNASRHWIGLGLAALVSCGGAGLAGGGCGLVKPRGVPAGAVLSAEATSKSSFTSPADGMVYLYRAPVGGGRGQLHYSGPIRGGQVLTIDPAQNKATLDGEELEVLLPGGDVLYQAYFREDPTVKQFAPAASRRREPRTSQLPTRQTQPSEPMRPME
jgi:hypothetical protein